MKSRSRKCVATVNASKRLTRVDPTRTTSLRRFFMAKVGRQFALLKGKIIQWVQEHPLTTNSNPTGVNQYTKGQSVQVKGRKGFMIVHPDAYGDGNFVRVSKSGKEKDVHKSDLGSTTTSIPTPTSPSMREGNPSPGKEQVLQSIPHSRVGEEPSLKDVHIAVGGSIPNLHQHLLDLHAEGKVRLIPVTRHESGLLHSEHTIKQLPDGQGGWLNQFGYVRRITANTNPNHDEKGRFTTSQDTVAARNKFVDQERAIHGEREAYSQRSDVPSHCSSYFRDDREGKVGENLEMERRVRDIIHKATGEGTKVAYTVRAGGTAHLFHRGQSIGDLYEDSKGLVFTSGHVSGGKKFRLRREDTDEALKRKVGKVFTSNRLLDNQFCPTGQGGGVDPSCRRSTGMMGENGPMPPRSFLRKALHSAVEMKAQFSEKLDKVTDVVVLRQVKAGMKKATAIKDKLIGAMKERYGTVATYAIMASAQTIGTAAMSQGVILPGSGLWGMIPGVAIAEGVLQASRAFRKVKSALTGNEEITFTEILDHETLARQFLHAFGEEWGKVVENSFCPTGEGGGVDPTCSPKISSTPKELQLPDKDGIEYGVEYIVNPTKLELEAMLKNGPLRGLADSEKIVVWEATRQFHIQMKRSLGGVVKLDIERSSGKTWMKNHEKPDEWSDDWPLHHPYFKRYHPDPPKSKFSSTVTLNFTTNDEHDSPFTMDWSMRRGITVNDTSPPSWAASSSQEKLAGFQEWLKTQVNTFLTGRSQEALWRAYIHQGWRKGVGRTFDDVNKVRPQFTPEEQQFYAGSKDQFLRSSFNQPVAKEKVELLAARTFDEMESVTDDMANRMSRVLADGMVQGKSPYEVAKDLTEMVDFSRKRAEVVARTELIRSHAEGQLTAMEQLGVDEVGVQVEFLSTPDARVCDICASYEGTVLSIADARGVIPQHPQCRCAWVPNLEGT